MRLYSNLEVIQVEQPVGIRVVRVESPPSNKTLSPLAAEPPTSRTTAAAIKARHTLRALDKKRFISEILVITKSKDFQNGSARQGPWRLTRMRVASLFVSFPPETDQFFVSG